MSLSAPSVTASPAARSVPVALFVVGLLVVGGVAALGTAAYLELRPAGRAGGPSIPSPTPHNGTGPANGSGTTNQTPPPPAWLNLTDDLGRTVRVPYDPARVVVLGPSIMDSMYRLGLRDRVVGVDCYAPAYGGLSDDYSPDQVSLWNLSTSLCVETAPDFDFEALQNASPQLVLASTIVSVAAVEQIQDQYGIPVFMLQPPTLSGIEVDVSTLGAIFDRPGPALALDSGMQQVLGRAQNVSTDLLDNGTPLATVLVTYSVDPAGGTEPGYWTYGPGSFGQSLIEVASGANIAGNSTLPYPLLTGDQVLLSDPSVIVYGTGYGLNESAFAQGPDWSLFGAVQNGTVYGIDSNDLTEPGPTMILDGLPVLMHLLEPSLVPPP